MLRGSRTPKLLATVSAPEAPIEKSQDVWAKFDVNKLWSTGKELHYIAPEMRDGVRLACITVADVQEKVSYWASLVVCTVVSFHPFPYDKWLSTSNLG